MSNTEVFTEVNGVRQRVFKGGQGQSAVFMHGGAGLSVWTPFFDALSQDCALSVPEHPGFGKSGDRADYRSIADLAYHYLDWFEAQMPPRFHLVANSIGGWMAAEAAVRDPSRFISLTLIGPAGILPEGAAYEDSFAWDAETAVRKLFHNQAIADRLLSTPPSDEQKAVNARNQATVAKLGQATRLHNPDLPRWLHRIKCPTLIVWGANDALMPASFAKAWTAALPNASEALIAEAGHLPHAEQAAATSAVVRAFIAQHKQPAA